jgi:ankyrin repeat protein
VNLLLTSGASVNNKSMDRYTPLLSACARGFSKARNLTVVNLSLLMSAVFCE